MKLELLSVAVTGTYPKFAVELALDARIWKSLVAFPEITPPRLKAGVQFHHCRGGTQLIHAGDRVDFGICFWRMPACNWADGAALHWTRPTLPKP